MRIAEVIRTVGSPFIIGADWQNTPNKFTDSGFLSCINGVVVRSGQGTCFSYLTKKWSEIDYFVVSEGIAHAFEPPKVDLNATTTPHLPVSTFFPPWPGVDMSNILPLPKPSPTKCP